MKSKPKILVFVDWYLPGYRAGGPIKSIAGLVNALKGKAVIDLVTRDRDLKGKHSYPGIKIDEWTTIDSNTRICYLSPGLHVNTITRLTSGERYNAIYTNSFFSFHYSIKIRLLYKAGKLNAPNYIVAPRGELKRAALDVKPGKKKIYLAIAKITNLYRSVIWHATSEIEATDIKENFGPDIRFFQLPNLSPLSFPGNNDANKKPSNELKLVFLSRIIEYKNLAFALQVLSTLELKANEKIIFDIYGPIESAEYWERCKAMMAELLSPQVIINYKGEVDGKDVGDVLALYDLFIFPTLGENFGHVIAESLIAGTPVLISDRTPWTDIEQYNAGWSVSLEAPEKFADKLLHVLRMPAEDYEVMISNVRLYASERINSQETIHQYVEKFS